MVASNKGTVEAALLLMHATTLQRNRALTQQPYNEAAQVSSDEIAQQLRYAVTKARSSSDTQLRNYAAAQVRSYENTKLIR